MVYCKTNRFLILHFLSKINIDIKKKNNVFILLCNCQRLINRRLILWYISQGDFNKERKNENFELVNNSDVTTNGLKIPFKDFI